MGRTKVEIDVSALGLRMKTMNIIIGSNTTASDVVSKVLEKLRVQEPPKMYQLLAIPHEIGPETGRILGENERPSHVLKQATHPTRLKLHHAITPVPPNTTPHNTGASSLIRVYHNLDQGIQTYRSIIVSPVMKANEVLKRALSTAAPSDSVDDYSLVLVTPEKDTALEPEECPHSIGRSSSSHFELRRKKQSASSLKIPFQTSSPTSHLSSSLDLAGSSSYDGNSLANLSTTELMTGKLKLHSELIDALHEFASQSNSEGLFETSGGKSRETVLEQALVEQNQILDVMQELISKLESENKHSRERINKQGRIISGLEVKSSQDEKALAELRSKSQALLLKRDDPRIADLKRQLSEKEQATSSLRTRFKHESESLLSAKLASIKTKLEIERVHCIELEEELSQLKGRMTRLNRNIADKDSVMLSKESEIMHLKHEMESLRNFEQQQQDLVMKLRATLSSKDVQLRSLTRALNKEKKVADQLRRIQVSLSGLSHSPGVINKVGDASCGEIPEVQHGFQTSLFEQIAGRTTYAVELTRIMPKTELGFSFSKADLPVSSRVPCLIVKAVKEGSLADSLLNAGDELLEVNGILCRSVQQSRAVNVLERGVGILKIVVARMSSLPNKVIHSTPIKRIDGLSNGEVSATWTTALHSPSTAFQSFSVESSIVSENQNEDAKFVTVPESYALPATINSSDDQMVDVSATGESLHHREPGEKQCPSTSASVSSVNESESIITVSSKDEISVKKLQYEIADLQDQLDESERIRLNYESVLDATRKELDQLRSDHEAEKSENSELQQQLFSRDGEMNDIQQYISELQTALVALQSEVVDDQQKIASLENQNKMISGELMEVKNTSSQASEMKRKFEEMVLNLKSELEKREKNEKEMGMALQEQTLENTRLGSDAVRMENELKILRDSLDSIKQESEVAIATMKQEHQQLQSQLEEATEVSEKTKISSQEQYEHFNTQLKSAKSLLVEAETKDSQVQMELRYLKQAADQANKQLEKLEAKYHTTLEELQYFKQEAERKTLEMESMTVGLKGAQIKLNGKQEMTTRLQTEVDNLRRTNAKLRNEAIHLKEMVKEAQLDLKASNAEEERLGKKMQESMREKNELFVQLEKSFEESTELSLKVEELGAELKRLKEEDLSDSKNAMEKLVKSLKLTEARLKGELESSQKRVEMLTHQSSRMKSEVKTTQSQCETMAIELKQARSEKEYLTASKDELSKELADMQERYSNLQYELDSKRQEVDDSESILMQLREQVRIKKEHSTEHLARISELESELERVQSEKKKADGMVASLEFMQKQDEERLEQAKQFVQGKEKSSRRMSVQIDDVNALLRKSNLENTALTTSVASMKQQLKESQRVHTEVLKNLKEELAHKEKKSTQISDDLESHRSKNEMLDSKVEHLTISMEKLAREKHSLEDALESSVKESTELQNLNQQLRKQVDRLKAELDNMVQSSDSLSSESAGLRQQLRQNEKEIDQLTAQLHATEINLEVSHRTIHKSERENTAQAQKLESLESQCKESHSKMEEFSAQLDNSSLELCKRDEELSKLRITLELRQKDSTTLQDSLIAAQNSADLARKQVQELDTEHCKLLLSISELQDEKKMAQESIRNLKEEISNVNSQNRLEVECYQSDIEALRQKEKEYNNEINRLKCVNQELEKSRNKFISAQEEMKTSISKIGNDKDIEIIKLQDDMRTLNQKLDDAKEQHNTAIENEKVLKEQVSRLERGISDLEEQVKKEKLCNEDLRSEIEVHQATSQGIHKLDEKVTLLSDGLREKTKQLTALEETHISTESELEEMQLENKALLENVSELATLKLTMVEQAETIKNLKKRLTEKETSYEQVLNERDQFLSTVRELEVHNHTLKQSAPTSTTTGSTGSEAKEKEEFLQIVRQKENEVLRTREYTEQLLINVMMKAPFLLEK